MANPVIKSAPAPVSNLSGSSVTTGNLTVANGDLVVAAVHCNGATLTCTDSQGNTFTQQQTADPFGGNAFSWFTTKATAGSSTYTVTGGESGGGNAYNMLAVYIIDGTTIAASFWDTSGIGNNSGNPTTAIDTGPTQANCAGGDELVLAVTFSGTNSIVSSYSVGSGYTLDNSVAISGNVGAIGDEHKNQTGVTTTVNATFTGNASDVFIAGVAVIKGTAAAAASPSKATVAVQKSKPRQQKPQIIIAVPTGTQAVIGLIQPGQTWRNYFQKGILHPQPPAPLPPQPAPIVTIAIQKPKPKFKAPVFIFFNITTVPAQGAHPPIAPASRWPRVRQQRPTITSGTGPPFNSGGLTPIITIAVQKPKPKQKKPFVATGPPFNSGSLMPIVTVSVQKAKTRKYKATIVIPGTSAAVVQGTAPIVTIAIQKPKPKRGTSDYSNGLSVLATLNSQIYISSQASTSGVKGVITIGRYSPKPLRRAPRVIIAPLFNSGGFVPTVTVAVQKKPKPTKGTSRLRIAPLFNSGGAKPIVTISVQKRKPLQKKGAILTPSYNSGGIAPIVVVSIQKRKPTRPSSKIATARIGGIPGQGTTPSIVVAVQRKPPRGKRVSQLVVPPTFVPPGTKPIITISIQKPKPLQKKPRINPGLFTPPASRTVTLLVVEKPQVSIAPGLFRSSGAIPGIIIQFRPFTIKILNKVDKS